MLKIEKIDTSKHGVRQRQLMEAGVIPNHPGITIFSGAQGSGKSNLVANILKRECMYGKSYELMEEEIEAAKGKSKKNQPKKRGYFDAIFMFLGSDDDMFEHLIDVGLVKQNHVCHMPTPDDVQKVIDGQKDSVERSDGDMTLVPRILCLFDDVVNDSKLMRSKPFLELFVKGRHINSSTWFLTQYLNLVPKPCRLQANWLFVFKVNRAEMQIMCEQYCPAGCTKKEFSQLVEEATQDDGEDVPLKKRNTHNFFVIAKRAPEGQKFRKNLDKFINLKRMGHAPEACKFKKMKKPTKKELEDREFEAENMIKTLKQEASQERRIVPQARKGNVHMSNLDSLMMSPQPLPVPSSVPTPASRPIRGVATKTRLNIRGAGLKKY